MRFVLRSTFQNNFSCISATAVGISLLARARYVLFAVKGGRFALELELYRTLNDAAVTSEATEAADVSHQDTLFHSKWDSAMTQTGSCCQLVNSMCVYVCVSVYAVVGQSDQHLQAGRGGDRQSPRPVFSLWRGRL